MDSTIDLANLLQWSLQVALLTAVGTALLPVLKIEAPVMRHAFWRTLLVVCLALPLVQPWSVPAPTSLPIGLPQASTDADTSGPHAAAAAPSTASSLISVVRTNWASWAVFVLAVGTAVRLSWLLAGFLRLRRLRQAGELLASSRGYDDVATLIEAGAEMRCVAGLRQPVTFGLVKPVVLLPERFPDLPPALRQAVIAHELWHVRRRDWAWVLLEESIRAILWFNPAVWWLISNVQSTREEVVDQLTVQLTNARRSYLEALLTFADEPTLFPAAPFARRRHLFHRMQLISREAVMSSRRIAASSIVVAVAVLVTGWYGTYAFPLTSDEPAAASSQQTAPRDRRPGEPGPETNRERQLKTAITEDASNRDLYLQLAGMQQARGAGSEAVATLNALRNAFPNDARTLMTIAKLHLDAGRFEEAVQLVEQAAGINPTDPKGYQVLATFYFEKTQKDPALSPAERSKYLLAGVAAADRALSLDPDYVEAMVYKNLFLRVQANLETDGVRQRQLIAEADALRARAIEMSKTRRTTSADAGPGTGYPPPPPPPPPPPGQDELVDGQRVLRIGGQIKPPRKLRDVKPVYPEAAQIARVQGVVILEATIDAAGDVVKARVLRGEPLLDQAAVDAVTQWKFEPTQLNGAPIPVMMTLTVNFTMQD
jgi:TonB family protein